MTATEIRGTEVPVPIEEIKVTLAEVKRDTMTKKSMTTKGTA